MLQKQPIGKSQTGQSMVEFAMSLVLMLILLAGIVDLGRAFFAYIAIRDAAQEGALYGSVCPSGDVEGRVEAASTDPVDLENDVDIWIDPGNCDGTCECSATPGDCIKVKIDYDFPISMPFLGTIIGSQTIVLSTEVTDTILTTTCP